MHFLDGERIADYVLGETHEVVALVELHAAAALVTVFNPIK
jgi:hypothetical protein